MQFSRHRLGLVLFGVSLLYVMPATATTVYRSIDADGTVRFSDSPPTDGSTAEALTIATPAAQPDELLQQRLEEMRETTDRMADDRMAREKHRAELRKLNREERYAAQPPNTDNLSYSTPDYYYQRYWRHPGHRPFPAPPHTRPPVRPLPAAGDYPASLIRRHYQPSVRKVFETPRH